MNAPQKPREPQIQLIRSGCMVYLAALLAIVWIATTALGATPNTQTLTDQVDLIEVNHYYDSQGRLVFDQVIFYEWSHSDARFQVVAWRLLKDDRQIPRMDWRRGVYVARWRDGEVWREVRAARVRETWTTVDPEVLERSIFPIENRRELSTADTPLTAGQYPPTP